MSTKNVYIYVKFLMVKSIFKTTQVILYNREAVVFGFFA